MNRSAIDARLATVGITLAAVAAWELVARSGVVSRLSLVPFSDAVRTLPHLVASQQFTSAVRVTSIEVGISFVIAAGTGVLLGLLMARSRVAARGLRPYLGALMAYPVIIVHPALVVALGLGELPFIVIGTLAAVVPVALASEAAFVGIPAIYRKLAQTTGMDAGERLRYVLLPAAWPRLLPGVRLGLLFCVLAVIGAEFLVSADGVGHLVAIAYREFQIADMYGYVLLVATTTATINGLLYLVERRVRADLA